MEFGWSGAEKKIARRAFERALDSELQALLAEFKAKAASIDDPRSVWDIRDWLSKRQRQIDELYDFRYSQLSFVFGRLVRDGKLAMSDLAGLSEDKLEFIQRVVDL
jgi:Photoprotection regulator fluorescence recovery protein